MSPLTPKTAEEMAGTLAEHGSAKRAIELFGNNSKRTMGGPLPQAEVRISTAALNRVLMYEPGDLTISVEAGMLWTELQALLARNGQMVGIDPPLAATATVGGVVAANSSGSIRRRFGTARDQVIGMRYAMVSGKIAESGGMVVKNVAGLDVAKIMIGSFGTLAAIVSVNFRLHPLPETTRTALFTSADLDAAIVQRDKLLRTPWRWTAIDLLTPVASARLGLKDWTIATRIDGVEALAQRFEREFPEAAIVRDHEEENLWQRIREFSPEFLARQPNGVVIRVSSTLTAIRDVLKIVSGTAISRAGNGVTNVYVSSWSAVGPIWRAAAENGWAAAIAYAPDSVRRSNELWLLPADAPRQNAFAMMKKVKDVFDPDHVLNRFRLYGRI